MPRRCAHAPRDTQTVISSGVGFSLAQVFWVGDYFACERKRDSAKRITGGLGRLKHPAISRTQGKFLCLSPLIPAALLPGVGALISLVIVVITLVVHPEARPAALALRYRSTLFSILLGLGVAAMLAVVMGAAVDPLLERIFGPIELDDFSSVEGNLGNFLLMLALGLLFGGIAEELIFRGFLIGWGVKLFGTHAAIPLAVLSAASFGFTHLYQGWAGVFSTGLIGLSFGLLYVFSGRKLLPVIVAHMATNFYGITLLYLGH